MAMRLSGNEFRSLGLAIDPDDPSRAIQVASIEGILPDDNWDLDRLATYASSGLAEAARLDEESIQIGRRLTVRIFRSGRALSIARRLLKSEGRGRWGQWLKSCGIKRTTAWEAAELFERAKSEDAVVDFTPAQARQKFGITGPPRENHGASRNRSRLETPQGEDDLVVDELDVDHGEDDEAAETGDGELAEGGVKGEGRHSLEPDRSEDEALFSPPNSLKELLSAAYNLLLECERRRGEVEAVEIPLIAEIVEVATRLSSETPRDQ